MAEQTKEVKLFTDGSCLGNPGAGGWGAILQYGTHEKVLCGGAVETTNNRMELTAVIEGLSALKQPCAVTLISDSKYVIDGLEKGWAVSWEKNNWRKKDKSPALNADLWAVLLSLTRTHQMTYHWVKGHAGHPENERCDQMATAKAAEYQANV